jgi:hypothetical protein
MFNRIVGHAMGKTFGNNSGVKLSSKNFFKGIGNRSSLPRKVGTKEGWKQAVVTGLQTNWDLNAMAQGYYLGQQQAKKQRINANLILSGIGKIIIGVGATLISYFFIKNPWLAGFIYSVGTSLIADGGDEYNQRIGKKNSEDRQKTIICGREGKNPSEPNEVQPWICFWGSASPNE